MTGQGDVSLPVEMRSVRASSITSNKSSKRRKNNRKKKAKEWTYYIETLKSSIDCLYEICRTDHSIIGCKEALMYLQNADKDFHSLIEVINLEKNFSKEEPQAVAWEIRKTINSPTHNFHEKSAQKLMGALPISPIVINELSLVNSLVKDDTEPKEVDPDDGWQVVSRSRRRKSNSSSLAESVGDRRENEFQEEEITRQRPPSVYERLSSGISCRKHGVDSPTRAREISGRPVSRGSITAGGKLTCPRSAMDLPQTKASMAKISYCRQRLWEKDVKPKLAEKLAGQKRERVQRPSASVCQINFSDPSAVRKRALEYSENLKQQRKKTAIDTRSLQSLQAINENGELDGSGDIVPADPKPSNAIDITTRSEPPRDLPSPLDLDVEWREMTEEEQSLAMEEHSLNLEIEKAESELESMDAEMLRQVDEEAMRFPLPEEDSKRARAEMFRKLEDEFKNFLELSWSDLMDKELSNIHEPGMVAERHEKMCSPTRRRCEKDDDDFSKKHTEKIRRADEAREKLQQERRQKLQELAQRRDEVRAKQAALIEKKRLLSEKRMEKAQENRDKNITEIVKKAKSDEQRVAEIQFINTMQDDNMRFMMQSKEQHVEERKQILVEERAKKIEEKAMKDQAVEERRKAAEQKRLQRIQENEEKRAKQTQLALEKKKSAKRKKEEKEKELIENPNLLPLPHNYFSLDSIVTRQNWPSSQVLDDPITCIICNETMTSKLDCFVHILSENHLAKAEITAANATPSRIKEELNSLKIDKRPPCQSETRPISCQSGRERSISRVDLQSYNFKRGNDQFRALYKEPTCSHSPETEILLSELSAGKITDSLVDALNAALKFLLKGNVAENGAKFVPLVEPILKMIVSLDETMPLPTLIKLCTIVEKASSSLHFALKCLFSSSILQLFDGLNKYSQENPSSPYFSAIMDVCLSLLQPLSSKKELETLSFPRDIIDDRVALIYELITDFGANIPSLIGRGDSAAKWTRIHNFASVFLDKVTDDKSLSIVYIDSILRETYEAFRLATGNDTVDRPNRCDSEITSKLANRLMHILERLQHTRKPILWACLFNNPIRNFRFCLLCTELMRRCILTMKRDATGLELVPQLLFLLRYFVSKSTSHQILCMLGDEKSTIGIICQLPNEFFNQAVIATQSIPTLILMSHGSLHCRQELLTKRICIFIGNFIKNAPYNEHSRMCLKPVLAEDLWKDAVKFYHF